MKYLCLGYLDEKVWEQMSESERNVFFEDCAVHNELLRSRGCVVGGESLEGVRSAVTLRYQSGRILVTDGPFAETKEQLGGFLVLEARDLNHAIQMMSHHPGVRLGGSLEIRPIDEHNSCQGKEKS